MLEIEQLILKDIQSTLSSAKRDLELGSEEAAKYHLEQARSYCTNLKTRLDEILKKLTSEGK